jgi:hypothetical protein
MHQPLLRPCREGLHFFLNATGDRMSEATIRRQPQLQEKDRFGLGKLIKMDELDTIKTPDKAQDRKNSVIIHLSN